MVECKISLRSTVTDWHYRQEVQLSGNHPFGKSLRLEGEFQHSGFTSRMPFSICIVTDLQNFTKDELSDMNKLEINDGIQDYDISENLEVTIPVNCDQLEDLKACLVSTSNHSPLSVEVELCVEGLQKSPIEEHRRIPIEGRPMMVNEFAWYLKKADDAI